MFNPNQLDSDNDGTGDACECVDIVINGPIEACLEDVSTYSIMPNISNNDYDWIIPSIADYIWQSAEEASLAIQWIDTGEASVAVMQECLGGSTQIIQLNVTILSNDNSACTIKIDEVQNNEKKVMKIIDILGREVHTIDKHKVLLYIYNDGSIEKKYNLD